MIITVPTNYYKQFDADFTLDVPGEGFGGWHKANLELNTERTALVVLHAWDAGTHHQFPGWHRAVEYFPRADEICSNVLPGLLNACRNNGIAVLHVIEPVGSYYQSYPGHQRAVELVGTESPPLEQIEKDVTLLNLEKFKREEAFPGKHNLEDIERGFGRLDIPMAVKPIGNEGVAATSEQLFALCKEKGINHLIYTGFALNACIFQNPGGMIDMRRRGIFCSVVSQAVTAVENKETASRQLAKELSLWQTSLFFGLVYDADDLVHALQNKRARSLDRMMR
ncbi:hypothetical protein Back11_41630 [Paenibacillus baekrokdamisoli]|uniref:Uncharacterized protein n=1 Tax=Paenibacillus baekrokdamisoli TaxID=1712516 RepID=A0A3G9JFI8_9BACL|nr:isochorismatase family protein [Paenibacillus baekrokdamisoli]MBB3068138.1 nicotinamidase-related amidase [Paenibacillus baekrokdamisoli]BBH22818.1 hypothetical protein Back11_41630 [Paenibacillus baekrokdamisoli]